MSNSDNEFKREMLLKIAGLVAPALARHEYIPALTHIRFDGLTATAYNDVSAISVRFVSALKGLLPGELLIKALNSFNAENVLVQDSPKGGVVVSSGRAKVTLPSLGLADFPLEMPQGKAPEIPVSAEMLEGMKRCLISIGSDPTHPATMGVTLDVDQEGCAVLYSTDNHTISRFQTDTAIKLPGDAPVILPTFFCEQVAKLAAAYPDAEAVLLLYPGAIVAEFGNDLATLFSKTLVDVTPMEFPRFISKHCDLKALRKEADKIPDGFDAALDRALLVLAQEADKVTKIEPEKGERFTMTSASKIADASDRFSFESDFPDKHFLVDPVHLARAAKSCTHMAFLRGVVAMCDKDQQFVHLISHVAAA